MEAGRGRQERQEAGHPSQPGLRRSRLPLAGLPGGEEGPGPLLRPHRSRRGRRASAVAVHRALQAIGQFQQLRVTLDHAQHAHQQAAGRSRRRTGSTGRRQASEHAFAQARPRVDRHAQQPGVVRRARRAAGGRSARTTKSRCGSTAPRSACPTWGRATRPRSAGSPGCPARSRWPFAPGVRAAGATCGARRQPDRRRTRSAPPPGCPTAIPHLSGSLLGCRRCRPLGRAACATRSG